MLVKKTAKRQENLKFILVLRTELARGQNYLHPKKYIVSLLVDVCCDAREVEDSGRAAADRHFFV